MNNYQDKEHLLLFSNCIPVKGAARSVIVDLQRSDMFFIDNYLFDILQDTRTRPWKSIRDDFDEESQGMLDEYVEFLESNELCFRTEEPERYPPLNMEWDSPAVITNAIIDARAYSDHPWEDLFGQLTALGCRDIQVRFFDPVDITIIEQILQLLQHSYIKSIELIMPYMPAFTKKYLNQLVEKNVRIKTIALHSARRDELVREGSGSGMENIIFLKQQIDSHHHCGMINSIYFNIHEPRTFAEFRQFNSCLNRKIGIDENGDIRNCPSMKTSFGNIATHRLRDVIDDHFKEVWGINKDQIETCRNCEFRYVCSDCRAHTTNPEDPFSKPEKCGYDPYKMEWK